MNQEPATVPAHLGVELRNFECASILLTVAKYSLRNKALRIARWPAGLVNNFFVDHAQSSVAEEVQKRIEMLRCNVLHIRNIGPFLAFSVGVKRNLPLFLVG